MLKDVNNPTPDYIKIQYNFKFAFSKNNLYCILTTWVKTNIKRREYPLPNSGKI